MVVIIEEVAGSARLLDFIIELSDALDALVTVLLVGFIGTSLEGFAARLGETDRELWRNTYELLGVKI